MDGIKICPKCGAPYIEPPAMSRDDDRTEICQLCGMAEALSEAYMLPFNELRFNVHFWDYLKLPFGNEWANNWRKMHGLPMRRRNK